MNRIEKEFQTQVVVDEHTMDTPTHKIDCFRNSIALEIEWNNKDPFYDRDLNNFRLLFDLRAISPCLTLFRQNPGFLIIIPINTMEIFLRQM